MGIPVLAGRDFSSADQPGGPTSVIVSRALAEEYWGEDSPVGQTLLVGDPDAPTEATVIGVAGDVKHRSLDAPVEPSLYFALRQRTLRRRFLVIAGPENPSSLAPSVRAAIREIDADLPITIRPMSGIVRESTFQWGISALVLLVLGGAALLLASLGIYGIISYSVAQRRREIGLRMALGATERHIRNTFVGEGMRLAGLGVVVGVLIAAGLGQLMTSMLFGVTPLDPVTLVAATILFGGVAVGASAIPALRASRVDPQGALRYE